MKTAIVTGGARGIGREIALTLAEAGMNIVINYNRSDAAALEVKALCEAKGVGAHVVQCDVSIAEDVKRLVKETLDIFGTVDVLVNNAGITKDGLVLRMSESDFDDVIAVNLKGTFNCAKAVGRQMLKKRTGVIINVASVVGLMGNAGQANYAASKAGVIGLTKSLAKEFAARGVRVNAVAPGFIASDMTDALPEEVVDNYKTNIPLGSLGEPKDVADLVSFLASDAARYITGQVVSVDGGLYM